MQSRMLSTIAQDELKMLDDVHNVVQVELQVQLQDDTIGRSYGASVYKGAGTVFCNAAQGP